MVAVKIPSNRQPSGLIAVGRGASCTAKYSATTTSPPMTRRRVVGPVVNEANSSES